MSSVTSISLSAKLRNKLDEIKYERGYSSRSEVVKDATKTYYSNRKYQRFIKSGPHLDEVLLHLRHEYEQGNLQLHVEEGDNCAEIYVTRNAENFIGRIRAIIELNK